MVNSNKLSLFRDFNSQDVGFIDIEVGRTNIVELNNETIDVNKRFWFRGPWISINTDLSICAKWCSGSAGDVRNNSGRTEQVKQVNKK